ncbi:MULTISPECIES: hypothetical protein [unclassified Pseudomonas]|nr:MULTISPECIES: hypothetical protein [unclassified Pseudomonas]
MSDLAQLTQDLLNDLPDEVCPHLPCTLFPRLVSNQILLSKAETLNGEIL